MKGIASKIIAISKAIGAIGKNGKNQEFGFAFQSWEDVLRSTSNACRKNGLWVIPSVSKLNMVGGVVYIDLELTVIDVESGEKVQLSWIGESRKADDKGLQQAITSAYKYAVLKIFMIPVQGDVDPDAIGGVTVVQPKAIPKLEANKLPIAEVISISKSMATKFSKACLEKGLDWHNASVEIKTIYPLAQWGELDNILEKIKNPVVTHSGNETLVGLE